MRRFMLITEMHRIQTLLLENRVDVLRQKYVDRIRATVEHMTIPHTFAIKFKDENNNIDPNKIFDALVETDPDPTKKNTQWLLNLFVSNRLPIEDFIKIPKYLTTWMEKKKRKELPPEAMDLGRIKSLGDLYEIITDHDAQVALSDDQELQEATDQSQIWMNTDRYTVLSPLTEFSAQFWGRDTEWCTAWGDPKGKYPSRTSQFSKGNAYGTKGYLYIIFDKKDGKKWQFQFETKQFMNVSDSQINLNAFCDLHPEIEDFFNKMFNVNNQEVRIVFKEFYGVFDIYEYSNVLALCEVGDTPDNAFSLRTANNRGGKSFPKIFFDNDDKTIIGAVGFSTNRYFRDSYSTFLFPFLLPERVKFGKVLANLFNKSDYALKSNIIEFANFDLFYNGKWGTLNTIGNEILNDGSSNTYRMIEGDNIYVSIEFATGRCNISITPDGILDSAWNSKITYSATVEEQNKLSKFFMKMLKKIKKIEPDGLLSVANLNEETQNYILEHKPNLADLKILLKIKGIDDPSTMKAFMERIEGTEDEDRIENTGEFIDGMLVFERFSTVDECFTEYGDKSSAWFMDFLSGRISTDADVYSMDHKPYIDDFLSNLDEDTLVRLGKYIAKKYEDEIKEEDGYDEDDDFFFDTSSVRAITNVMKYDFFDGDEINDLIYRAMDSGYESGAYNQAAKIVERELEDCPYFFLLKDGKSSGGFEIVNNLNDPCIIAAKPSEIVKHLVDENERERLAHKGWMRFNGQNFKPEEPRDGFNDYDEDRANEVFKEEIESFLNNLDDEDEE